MAEETQILREINWVLQYYRTLKPVMYLGYHRIALCERGISTGLRVTFDRDILWRTDAIALQAGNYGTPLLQPGEHLMEIKVPGAMPLWLADILDRLKIYPTSFSKYGRAYTQMVA